MTDPIQIRMGGYGPATTGFSRALKFIGDRLEREFGDRVQIKYVWNIMDFGYRAEDILWLVEHGVLTLGYQSSSYLPIASPSSASSTCRSCSPTTRRRAARWTARSGPIWRARSRTR